MDLGKPMKKVLPDVATGDPLQHHPEQEGLNRERVGVAGVQRDSKLCPVNWVGRRVTPRREERVRDRRGNVGKDDVEDRGRGWDEGWHWSSKGIADVIGEVFWAAPRVIR